MVTLLLLTGLFPVWFCFAAGIAFYIFWAVWSARNVDEC